METSIHSEEQESNESRLSRQAVSYIVHTLLALLSWALLMTLGYIVNPQGVPQSVILLLSIVVPLAAGFAMMKFRPSEMAPAVWLMGLIWILIIALWVLDMPTGPNECFQCGATEKITRTFLSLPSPGGLIDNDGPFLGTWPAAALMGYAVGAKLGLRGRRKS
ncbi:MAG: hypothetical protein ACLGPM_01410 [Acidobacteriota bacterium]